MPSDFNPLATCDAARNKSACEQYTSCAVAFVHALIFTAGRDVPLAAPPTNKGQIPDSKG